MAKKLFAVLVIAIALGTFLGTAIFFHLQRQADLASRQRVLEQETREQGEAEHSFPLTDAYKQAPLSYADSPHQHLYGRIVSDNSPDVLAATTAQGLDARLAAEKELKDSIARARQVYDDTVRSSVAAAAEYQSMLPGYGENRYRDEANLLEVKINTMKQQQPKLEIALRAAREAYEIALQRLRGDGVLFRIAPNSRVRVLDISDHYVKLRGLEDENRDKVFFVLRTARRSVPTIHF
jgi:hypothetical protein